MEAPTLLEPPSSDAAWFAQVQHWRSEAQDLKVQLHRTEHSCEARIREMQQRLDFDAHSREIAAKDAGHAFLSSAKEEVERLSRTTADAQERARLSDERVMGLLSESQEAADLMAMVTVKFERQVDISGALKQKLSQSQAETEKLRADLKSALQHETERSKKLDRAQATIETIMPRLTEEAKVEARMAEDAQEAKQRLKRAESMFNAQAQDLLAEVKQSHEEQAALGRKCAESYELANVHANAGYQWQQRTIAAEQELIRSGLNQHHLWENARRTRADQFAQEERLRLAEEERDRAKYDHVVADQARRELTGWVVASLDEVNRSAHIRPTGAHDAESFKGRAWVNMLETFRKDQQTRNGFGSRTRGPSPRPV